jgi:hypothetical protein
MVSKLANHKGKPKSFASSHVAFFDPSMKTAMICDSCGNWWKLRRGETLCRRSSCGFAKTSQAMAVLRSAYILWRARRFDIQSRENKA